MCLLNKQYTCLNSKHCRRLYNKQNSWLYNKIHWSSQQTTTALLYNKQQLSIQLQTTVVSPPSNTFSPLHNLPIREALYSNGIPFCRILAAAVGSRVEAVVVPWSSNGPNSRCPFVHASRKSYSRTVKKCGRCSDEIKWRRYLVRTRTIDVLVGCLVSCLFGWWVGWLAGG